VRVTGRSGYSWDGDKGNRPRKVRHNRQHDARYGRNSLPDQQQNDGVNISAKAATVPTVIANRTPTTASQEADTQVKRHDSFDEQAQGPISTSVVHRGEGTVYGRTGGRECNDGAGQPRENKDYGTR